jgi:2-methylisocitrate lyase-like PEP mutase family enzyme
VSVGGSVARAAFGALRRAAVEVLEAGTFSYTEDAMPGAEIAALMAQDHLDGRED